MTKQKASDISAINDPLKIYQDLVETSQDLIWQCDADGRYTYLNPAWETTFGYKIEEMIGRKFTDFQSPEIAMRDALEFNRLMKGGLVKGYETVHIGKSGQPIHLIFNAKNVVDDRGNVIGTRGTAYDITENKKIADELKQNILDHRALFENMYSGFAYHRVVFDENNNPVDYIFLEINRAFMTYTGLTRDIIGKRVTEVHPGIEKGKPDFIGIYGKVAITGEPVNFEVYFEPQKHWYKISAYCPKKGFFVALFDNITTQKKAEEQVIASNALLSNLARLVPGVIYQYRIYPDGRSAFPYSSPGMIDIYEVTPEEVIEDATPVYSRLHPDDYERIVHDIQESARTLNIFYCEFRVKLPRQGIRWRWCQAHPERMPDGGTLWHGIISDITERKESEEKLQNMQKLESLGVLAGGIAHDFNNLMAGIYGYLILANDESTDSQVSAYLSKAMNTIERARGLTAQLLTFAKGGGPVQKLVSLISFIEETVAFALSGSNISCVFDIDENIKSCNIDKNQIGQVIDNIIINAMQAMPDGGTIEVRAENISIGTDEHDNLVPGNYVKITIKDHGTGIPKDIINKIFDPFYTTKTKGHGLGLSTCYSIIKRHGGDITVESEVGKGSSFHFYLPSSSESPASDNDSAVNHIGRGTIIVMDDQKEVCDFFYRILESLGYDVVCKNDGKETLEYFNNEVKDKRNITAFILDLTVPGGIGGKEAVALIRKFNSEIPVFVSSGYAEDPIMRNPVAYGFTASLGKPFTKNELVEMLEKHIPKRKEN